MNHSHPRIQSVTVWPVDVPLRDPFVISRGAVPAAACAYVKVELDDGSAGYGEAAPFDALTGETRDRSVEAARRLGARLVGESCTAWMEHARALREAAPDEPAARAALECAMADAIARSRRVPLYEDWRALGGSPDVRGRETDITLPILEEARVDDLAAGWHARGFRTFKLKVGLDLDADVRRVERLAHRFPGVSFILDANQAFDAAGARECMRALRSHTPRVLLLEQPLPRDDVDGMAALRAPGSVPIAADESVFTLEDAQRVIRARAADCINLKVTKSGLCETIAIARAARDAGLSLMVGGMMETRLAMSFSFSLVLALGWVDHLDLDTPLLMTGDPVEGGYEYRGCTLTPWREPGVGARPRAEPPGA